MQLLASAAVPCRAWLMGRSRTTFASLRRLVLSMLLMQVTKTCALSPRACTAGQPARLADGQLADGLGQVEALGAERVADVQRRKLARQRGEADVEADAQQVALRAAVHHHLRARLHPQEARKLLHSRRAHSVARVPWALVWVLLLTLLLMLRFAVRWTTVSELLCTRRNCNSSCRSHVPSARPATAEEQWLLQDKEKSMSAGRACASGHIPQECRGALAMPSKRTMLTAATRLIEAPTQQGCA